MHCAIGTRSVKLLWFSPPAQSSGGSPVLCVEHASLPDGLHPPPGAAQDTGRGAQGIHTRTPQMPSTPLSLTPIPHTSLTHSHPSHLTHSTPISSHSLTPPHLTPPPPPSHPLPSTCRCPCSAETSSSSSALRTVATTCGTLCSTWPITRQRVSHTWNGDRLL